jgi:hypothetical protein
MLWVALAVGTSVMVGGYMSYAAEQAAIPKLEHRPGTPIEIVRSCREAVIPVAQAHARERGAELVRVDATSAGQTRRARNGQIAPVEVGVVYSAPGGRATRQGVIECRVDRRGRVSIADLATATR